jgi:hypothetical protein
VFGCTREQAEQIVGDEAGRPVISDLVDERNREIRRPTYT